MPPYHANRWRCGQRKVNTVGGCSFVFQTLLDPYLIEENCAHGHPNGLLQICIGKNDQRRFASQLQRHFFHVGDGRRVHYLLAYFRRSRETDLDNKTKGKPFTLKWQILKTMRYSFFTPSLHPRESNDIDFLFKKRVGWKDGWYLFSA